MEKTDDDNSKTNVITTPDEVKVKKPRTEAQIRATEKMRERLAAARTEKLNKKVEKLTEVEVLKSKIKEDLLTEQAKLKTVEKKPIGRPKIEKPAKRKYVKKDQQPTSIASNISRPRGKNYIYVSTDSDASSTDEDFEERNIHVKNFSNIKFV